jgi:hypothetical protein
MNGLDWIGELQNHYRHTLTFPEIRKGVVALSRIYVEKRGSIDRGAVFDGAAKRAAFACFYSPLHFLTVREVVRGLGANESSPAKILDLGCGLAVAGAAWATICSQQPVVIGFEKNSWAVEQARSVLNTLGVRGRVHRKPLETAPMPRPGEALVAAFAINEVDDEGRNRLLHRLLQAGKRGASILVVEPIARRPNPWWSEWSKQFGALSGRDDSWRFAISLPEPLQALDRASGLHHRELTARSLFVPARRERA